MQGLITMSSLERDRLAAIERVLEGRLSQSTAAASLGISYRQMKRLVAQVRRRGAAGVVSGKRGRISNHRLPSTFTDHILALIRERYADFGPTLACEKLRERHGITISRETLRKLLRDAGIWRTRTERRKAIQQPRARRRCYGELIQLDGSEHRWFEDRAPMCTVLTYVDDASSRLQLLRFVEGESTFDYMEATKDYLRRYGKPVAFYTDKHTVFHNNKRWVSVEPA
jgi:transposase